MSCELQSKILAPIRHGPVDTELICVDLHHFVFLWTTKFLTYFCEDFLDFLEKLDIDCQKSQIARDLATGFSVLEFGSVSVCHT